METGEWTRWGLNMKRAWFHVDLDTQTFTQLHTSQSLSHSKIFQYSYSNIMILRDAYVIILTCAVSPNNGIFCKVPVSTTDNLKKKWKQYHIVYWKLYCLRIIFSIPCTLPGIPCVRFQEVQTLCLEYYFYWNSLKRFQWAGGHLCHLKERVEGSLSIYLLILDTTKNKRSPFFTVIRWQEVHVFTMICVFLLPVSVLHLNATTDRPWVVFASTKSQSASTAYKRTRNVLH